MCSCTHLANELTLEFSALLKFGLSACVSPPWPLAQSSQHTHYSTVAPTLPKMRQYNYNFTKPAEIQDVPSHKHLYRQFLIT